MSRWVVVDDNSSGITYDGVWIVADSLKMDGDPASRGDPLYHTLHGTHSEAGIVFEFKGSSFVVIGSQFDSSSTPQWTCFVDDALVGPSENGSVGNNLQLCSKTVPDGTHRVVLNITATESDSFWFDNFLYLPSAGMELDNADVQYEWDDPIIQCDSNCDSNWDQMKDWTMTMTTGSNMTFNFNGDSLTWLGLYNNSHSRGLASGTYSVDGEDPIPFMLNNTSTDEVPKLANQQFFQTFKYPPGDHRIEVIYEGDPNSTPLTLEKLIVQNSMISSNLNPGPVSTMFLTSTATATATSIPTPPPTGSKTDLRMIASILGGAIGGFLFLVSVVIIFILLRRCSHRGPRRKGHPEDNFRDVIEPYTHNPLLMRPSNYDPLPTSSKRPILLGDHGAANGPLTPRPRDSRRSIMRSLLDSLTSASFGTSRRSENSRLTPLLPSISNSSYSHTRNSSSWVIVHEDSGVRLLSQGQEVVEIPPTYSVR